MIDCHSHLADEAFKQVITFVILYTVINCMVSSYKKWRHQLHIRVYVYMRTSSNYFDFFRLINCWILRAIIELVRKHYVNNQTYSRCPNFYTLNTQLWNISLVGKMQRRYTLCNSFINEWGINVERTWLYERLYFLFPTVNVSNLL